MLNVIYQWILLYIYHDHHLLFAMMLFILLTRDCHAGLCSYSARRLMDEDDNDALL
jgi:hypothetical protein